MAFFLSSAAMRNCGHIPVRYTCDGADVSPPISWSGAPPNTHAFSVVCVQLSEPARKWYHWAVYDIPRDVYGVPENQALAGSRHFPEAINDFGRAGYSGPCPPFGSGTRYYRFRIYAVSVGSLMLEGAHCRDVEHVAATHALAHADLVGLWQRPLRREGEIRHARHG